MAEIAQRVKELIGGLKEEYWWTRAQSAVELGE